MVDVQAEAPAGPYDEQVAAAQALSEALATNPKSKWKVPRAKGGITNKIHPREEEYAYVTPSDLRDFSDFGWLEYGLSQVGGFFFSGALWQAVSILSEQDKFKITPWLFSCALSMAFGFILVGVGLVLFLIKQAKIRRYFPKQEDPN